MDADGANLKSIPATRKDHRVDGVAWSPNGKQIAYSEAGTAQEVFVMDADGRNAKKLTELTGCNGHVCWSPDGKALAFLHQADAKERSTSIYVMDANGEHQKEIWTEDKESAAPALAWKPK